MDVEYMVDCLLHVAILFTVLTLFYKLYIGKVETKAFQSEFKNLIDHKLGNDANLKKIMSSAVGKHLVKSKNYAALEAMYSEPESGVRENNKWLFRSAMVASLGMAGMIGCLLWASPHPIPFVSLLGHNAATFALVGVVEAVFFLNVVSKFAPAPPSLMITKAIQAIKKALAQ